MKVTINDEHEIIDNKLVFNSAVKTDNYFKNPVVLFNNEPIGFCKKIKRVKNKLIADIDITEKYQRYKNAYMGFTPEISFCENDKLTIYLKTDLLTINLK